MLVPIWLQDAPERRAWSTKCPISASDCSSSWVATTMASETLSSGLQFGVQGLHVGDQVVQRNRELSHASTLGCQTPNRQLSIDAARPEVLRVRLDSQGLLYKTERAGSRIGTGL